MSGAAASVKRLVKYFHGRLEGMTSDEQTNTGASEETKRKFREALDRKKKAAEKRSGESHLDGGSAVQNTHGPAEKQREFRRKSG
ncbi:hypothetical protein QFZ29_001171 [Agromyces albus]|nr:hypothetical protein [Agromyces albus]